MVVKMKSVSIVGGLKEFDRVLADYILNCNIHLEHTLEAFPNTFGFYSRGDINPYERKLKRVIETLESAGIEYSNVMRCKNNDSVDAIIERVDAFSTTLNGMNNRLVDLNYEINNCDTIINTLQPIIHANLEIDKLINLQFLRFRFGRMPVDGYNKWETYLSDSTAYFYVASRDNNFVWGFYFVSEDQHERVDHIFSSIYFERVRLEGDTNGSPSEIIEREISKRQRLKDDVKNLQNQMTKFISDEKFQLILSYAKIKYHCDLKNIHKYCAYTNNSFYIVGWMEEKDALKLVDSTKDENEVSVIIEEPEIIKKIKPPTKLKNFKIFKPFEEFVRMYGTPDYYEVDPTSFLSVAYILMFGMMFGDIGHGVCLTIVALLMVWLKKGGFLAKILIPLGISSTVFGFLYGVFFGFEGTPFPPLWFTPMENSANMTRMLTTTVGMGVAVIIISFLVNICNGVKQKNVKKILLSQNGIAGFVFYSASLYLALNLLKHGVQHFIWLPILFIVAPLVVILFQEPLAHICKREKNWRPKGDFFLESFFELFEILLSYVTNTISFVRVGAFALNHAGMMSVVLLFMSTVRGQNSLLVAILGNVFVIGLEGLIVGIQVLRLGFYEMFSRFFDGTGREFKPIKE